MFLFRMQNKAVPWIYRQDIYVCKYSYFMVVNIWPKSLELQEKSPIFVNDFCVSDYLLNLLHHGLSTTFHFIRSFPWCFVNSANARQLHLYKTNSCDWISPGWKSISIRWLTCKPLRLVCLPGITAAAPAHTFTSERESDRLYSPQRYINNLVQLLS